ncbi:hypothetical protein E1176_14795 [Fulvivirga sp. RKSG066]|uniref:hypothetical protein n=1 Tax=Fulvivirga aurantia TaxID=2529383 RepID=UPI0012BBB116|nr:hypothetical protein [Fulvivirga aurantia]MTI22297.1 hypothetical protein [Fulvivirga aurantia]
MSKILIVLGLVSFLGLEQDKLVKTKVNDHITVSLPEDFFPMSSSDLAQRFPSVRQPIGAYTNMERIVDFSIKQSATQWRSSDIEIAKGFFKASLVNLYDRVKILKEEITTIDKKQFIVFEMETRINGDKFSLDQKDPVRSYIYVQYLLINGKTLVFAFNSPIQMKEEWQPMVEEMMQSIKVKKSV